MDHDGGRNRVVQGGRNPGKQQINRLLAMMRMRTGADISVVDWLRLQHVVRDRDAMVSSDHDTLLGSWPITQLRHDPSDNAEGTAVRVRIADATPSSGSVDSGQGLTWLGRSRSTSRRRTDRQTYPKEPRNG